MTEPVHGLPPLLREGMRVVVVPPRLKGPRERVVSSCEGSGTGQLVRLSGIGDLQASSELVGRTILCPEGELPDDFAAHDVRSLIGREVVDSAWGPLGTIEEVMTGPANDVWCVRGPHGEVLVPVVDAYLDPVGPQGPIRTHLPEGLVGSEGGGTA